MSARTATAAGSTTRFGTIRRSMSVAVTTTNVPQAIAAAAVLREKPNASTQPTSRSAVATSMARSRGGMRMPHRRQRPRSSAYESTGTLSYQAIGVSQLMHAEPGRTIERRRGTRAAITPRKLPSASPGTKTRGRTKSIPFVIDNERALLEDLAAGLAVVVRRREREIAGRRLDRERQDGDRREGAAELLSQNHSLGTRDERAFRHRALAGGDGVGGVEAALERALRRSDRDAGGAVRGEDEDLLVRVPVRIVTVVAVAGELRADQL